MSDPVSAGGGMFGIIKSGVLTKLSLMAVFGILGSLIIACFEPPKTKKQLFLQAMSAMLGTMIFGQMFVNYFDYYALSFIDLNKLAQIDRYTYEIPIYFLVGSLSWGLFSFLSKVKIWLNDKAADKVLK
ncbi:MAG: hypothetical protein ACRDBG_09670 [Waterburya sp.]